MSVHEKGEKVQFTSEERDLLRRAKEQIVQRWTRKKMISDGGGVCLLGSLAVAECGGIKQARKHLQADFGYSFDDLDHPLPISRRVTQKLAQILPPGWRIKKPVEFNESVAWAQVLVAEFNDNTTKEKVLDLLDQALLSDAPKPEPAPTEVPTLRGHELKVK